VIAAPAADLAETILRNRFSDRSPGVQEIGAMNSLMSTKLRSGSSRMERTFRLLFFGLLAILAVAERLWPRRPGAMERRSRWPANLTMTGLNLVTMSVIPISLITAASFAQVRGLGLLNHVALPIAALIAVNLVLRGFISFSTHYLMHKLPAFWRVHRVHHLDTELDVSSTVRFHPLEFVIALIPGMPMVLAFGLTPWILMVYELMDVVVTLWSHSNSGCQCPRPRAQIPL
jgi:sterol desaturase/sphingolipid hydroxylase (fatty acid hydroxylase superfamily)